MNVLWEWCFWEGSKLSRPFWWVNCWYSQWRKTGYCLFICLIFFNLMKLWNESWSRISWNAKGLAIFSKTQPFFLSNCSSNCCKILVNFEFWKNWFWQFLPVLLLLQKSRFSGIFILLPSDIFSWFLEQTILILMYPTL